MNKISFQQKSPKIKKLIEKIENLKQPSKFNKRKSCRNASQKLSNKDQKMQYLLKKKQIDIHSQALQTLTDAALNVKDLLSDFLIKAEIDEKDTFNIEDELKRIKKNKIKNPINIYSLIDRSDSDNNNNEDNDEKNFEKGKKVFKEFKRQKSECITKKKNK